MADIDEAIGEAVEKGRESRLNAFIALFVALAATLMAIDNIKDGNVGQAMAQAQAHGVDAWNYYQAKSTKQNLAESTLDTLQAMRAFVFNDTAPTEIYTRIDAGFSVAIALFGITALTRQRWLLVVAGIFFLVGTVFGLAGFMGWGLHPDRLMAWLS